MMGDGSREAADVCVIGAGPAGLTAAYLLAKAGRAVTVIEADPVYVGGIARTEIRDGYGIDVGGHRFFSKSDAVNALWDEILGPDDFVVRPRKSRIFYRNRFFDYPIRPIDALVKLGPVEAARCIGSYAKARLRPIDRPGNFADWVSNRFGRRLFEIFFESYTEKVWGMPCTEISADWAAQRIKGFSLGTAIASSIFGAPQRNGRAAVKTLIDRFRYPRLGPGMMWAAAARKSEALGARIRLGRRVTSIARDDDGSWSVIAEGAGGDTLQVDARHVISSMALGDLVAALRPDLPDTVRAAGDGLRYRDFIVVALVVDGRDVFDVSVRP